MGSGRSIEIAFPVLNEESVLEASVQSVNAFASMSLANWDVSLVVADNGSTDSTLSIGQSLTRQMPNLRTVSVERPGVGLALQKAWLTSTSDFVGFMDIDLATDLKHLPEVCRLFENGFDIVVGSRVLPLSDVRNRTVTREIMSRAFNAYVRRRTGMKTTDVMCGFKFMRRDAFLRVHDAGARSNGWFFSAETLLAAHALHLRVGEIPVMWEDDRRSKVKVAKHSLEFVRALERFLNCSSLAR